jgi:hypothetical protein
MGGYINRFYVLGCMGVDVWNTYVRFALQYILFAS